MSFFEAQIKLQIESGAGFAMASKTLLFKSSQVFEVYELLKKDNIGPSGFFQICTESSRTSTHVPALTYLGFENFETITVAHGLTKVVRGKEVVELKGNPFEVLAKHLSKYRNETGSGGFFSRGGAMGHFGFESVRYIEPILNGHHGSFKLNEGEGQAADIELFLFKKILIFDHQRGAVTVVCGFPVEKSLESNAEQSAQAVKALEAIEKQLSHFTADREAPPMVSSMGSSRKAPQSAGAEIAIKDLECSMGREKYVQCVLQLKEHIAAGDIFQAVLSEKFEKKFDIQPLELFRVLMVNSPSAYQFYFESESRALLGASPEMLLSVKNKKLETHPIAGTRPRGQDAAEERRFEKQLTQSVKENAEHLMLVDLARNDLGRISVPGKVKVGASSEIKKFPGVMHLVTRVFGELKEGKTALDALGACFPAGTLSGAPKIRAMQLLSELETSPRNFYGGAAGLVAFDDELEVCIAIRCAEVAKGRISFRAGAGIVADSRPQFEYDEILHKTRSLRQAIALVEEKAGLR